ncbi:ACP S-malonyltransferase [Catenisphaera adipataccumulans]|uniref:Malonyl CoA-acyl carrier protein transacylase n=1 Tax=Catenisphaera adipataccumulans TaxID=700500 RepID=A0A7W8CXR5_9FIRM|nr:ACP S-malonyltransferase [Catenisphaera adipataccumulans]MBB5182359.1 [acyl-carrier-protein] S-malonyltransferase [Catenisphaera adipataccumulans]
MTTAFLFAGQGSQYVGMGKDFYEKYPSARSVYDQIHMDFDVKDVCFNGPKEKLQDTAYTQSCVAATSLAIAAVLNELNIHAEYTAGLSLGEYTALTYAGAMSVDQVLPLVRKRGLIMAEALPAGTTTMMAVIRPDVKVIEQVCQEVTHDAEICTIANYNSPKQIVITGTVGACSEAKELLEKQKMRVIPLKVSGAFHSPLLKEASRKFLNDLNQVHFRPRHVKVVFNVSGQEETRPLPELLSAQMCSSVRFTQTIEYMKAHGVDTFIEIGPGHTLSKLVKQTAPDVQVYSIDRVEDLEVLPHV